MSDIKSTRTLKEMIDEAASRWAHFHARVSVWDNHEDIEAEKCWRHTFSYLCLGTAYEDIDIAKYVKTHKPEAIQYAKVSADTQAKQFGYSIDWTKLSSDF